MREVKVWLKLNNPHIDHVTIQLELKYLIGAKVARLKCRVIGDKAGPIAMVRVFVWQNPLQWFGSSSNPNPEPF